MSTKNEFSRLTIDMPKEQHRKLKAQAALMGKSMKDMILEALDIAWECLISDHIPNEETRKALEDPQYKKAKNVDDLFKKLDV